MEAFVGSWELVKEETSGVEEYIEANNLPATAREKLKERGGALTISCDGDQWCSETTDGDRKESFKFTLEQEVTHKYGPIETKSTFTWDSGKLLGNHLRNNKVTTTARYIAGDRLVEEITGNGVTMVTKYKKV